MCKNVCFNNVKEGVQVPMQNTSVTMSLKQLLKFTAPGNHRCALKHLCSWPSSSTKTFSYATSAQCPFEYTHAITRGIPKSFEEHSLKMDPSQQIVLSRAIEQLRKYVDVLKECGLEVITIPADEQYPDCVFVEDTALVIGQKACLTRPGHETRRGEVIILF